ncbi:MAG: SRPBCC family protein [Actinomycetota bacterium]
MTIHLREVIEVAPPIEEVFAFVADFANAERWDPTVQRSERVGGPDGVGANYALTIRFHGRDLRMTYTVVGSEPPRRVVLAGTSSTVNALDDISLEVTPSGGTRVIYRADLSMRHVLRVLEPRLRARFEEMGRNALAGMQAALDG